MNYLNPLFFLGGLTALAPVLLHLARRERADKFEFPTLLFLRRVSKKLIRYQKLRHLLLLLLRIMTLVLLALAFTRPFSESSRAVLATGRVAEAHILLVDNSMSMGYGDRWARAKEAAAGIVRNAQAGDKLALLEFSNRTVTRVPLTTDFDSVTRVIDGGMELTDCPTRYEQALRVAEQVAIDAETGKRVIHLITDFQKRGPTAEEQDFRLSPSFQLQPVDVGGASYSNLVPADVQVIETHEAEKGNLKTRLSVVNFGTEDRSNVAVALRVDGRAIAQKRLNVARGAVEPLEFQLPGLAPGDRTAVFEVEDERLTRDNRFSMMIRVHGRTPVLAVENPRSGKGGRAPSFFLAHALNLSGLSPYQLTTMTPREAELRQTFAGSLLIWNNAQGGSQELQQRLRQCVTTGNGLVVVLSADGLAADFNRTFAGWIPVKVEAPAGDGRRPSERRPIEDYSLITDIRVDHAIFRPFAELHSGNFSSAKFYHHAILQAGPGAQILARFDNGDPALVAADIGEGRVVVISFSADDSSNDLPLKAVYAPFWQQVLRHLHRYQSERRWVEVGDHIEPRKLLADAALNQQKREPDASQLLAIVDPAGQRMPVVSGSNSVMVEKAGFYELRAPGVSTRIAVNTVPGESDLAPGNPEEMVAGWLSNASATSPAASPEESLSSEEQERRQSLWLFLLIAAAACFVAEGWLSNKSVLKSE